MDLSQYEGTGLKAEDLIAPDAHALRKEQLDQVRRAKEQACLEEQIISLEKIIDANKQVGPSLLGVRLALEMALEIRDHKTLGSQSSKLILQWQKSYSSATIEEAIVIARTFLTQPDQLASAIRQKLFDGRA